MLGFDLTFAIVLVVSIATYTSMQDSIKEGERLRTMYDFFRNHEGLSMILDEIDAGSRGYALTGSDDFLTTYYNAVQLAESKIEKLKASVGDDPEKIGKVKELESLIANKISFGEEKIRNKQLKINDPSNELKSELKYKLNKDQIMAIMWGLKDEELNYFNLSNEERIYRANTIIIFFGILVVNVFTILGLVYYLYKTDMTGRKAAEEQLIKASEDIQDLYNNAPCGYFSINSEGKVVAINSTGLAWLQYPVEEICEKKLIDIMQPDSIPVYEKYFRELKKSGTPNDIEVEIIRKDGSTFPVMLNGSAVQDENGKFIKSRETMFDITERKINEGLINNLNRTLIVKNNQLESKNKELESFSYSVSHDLRAPLRAIDGFTNILKEEYVNQLDDEAKRLLEIIMSNSRRMGQLIDDLLAFSRLGRVEINANEINMREMVQSVVQEIKNGVSAVSIVTEVDDLPKIKGDSSMLQQVWVNLVSNAVKYSLKKESIKIKIGSYKEDGEHVFFVQDNGVGFDMKYSSKLFGVFQRLHSIEEFEGTGVGLAIVQRVVSRHGGRVWAEAKLNEGATFYFTIPEKSF